MAGNETSSTQPKPSPSGFGSIFFNRKDLREWKKIIRNKRAVIDDEEKKEWEAFILKIRK